MTVVPKRWIYFDTEDNIYFRGQKCTVFTEDDQDKYGVGYFGPRDDLRYPHFKGKIPEVVKPAEPRVSEPLTTRFCVSVVEPPPEVVKDPEYNEDKWLALREGPGPQSKLITKLGGYEQLEANTTKGDWTRISNVMRLNSTERNRPQFVPGWVRSKYVKKFPCENETKGRAKSGTVRPPGSEEFFSRSTVNYMNTLKLQDAIKTDPESFPPASAGCLNYPCRTPSFPPVVIRKGFGGVIGPYLIRYKALENVRIIVDGECNSGCTLVLANRNVCATDRALFYFHASRDNKTGASRPDGDAILMEAYPQKVKDWIASRGGLTKEWIGAKATVFLPKC